MGSAFTSFYTITNIGRPASLPAGSSGGMVFNSTAPDDLLIGGVLSYGSGNIYEVGVSRSVLTQSITGFTATESTFASLIDDDGGLTYGPGGYLFATQYPDNTIAEVKPGSSTTNYTVASGVAHSTGGLAFVPASFSGAGNAAITSYNGDSICAAAVTLNGDGSYSFGTCAESVSLPGAPEGVLYVAAGTPGFSANSILVNFYQQNNIVAYQIDAYGLPILSTAQTFVAGFPTPEGITVDPVTGDILVDTINGAIGVIHTDSATPEPGSFSFTIAALLSAGCASFTKQHKNRQETTRRNSK